MKINEFYDSYAITVPPRIIHVKGGIHLSFGGYRVLSSL